MTSIAVVLCMICIVSCKSQNEPTPSNYSADKKIKIVTTIYPEYDWVKNIIKGKEDLFDLNILMTSGIDLHNYNPTAKDILDVGTADLFVYVGGESDEWVEGVLNQAVNEDLRVLNLMDILNDKVKVEELKEGMEEGHEHEEEYDGEHEEEEEAHEEIECDEHVWLSINNAKIVCAELERIISDINVENESTYQNNLNNYIAELTRLDEEFSKTVSGAKRKLLIFGDRFPFRYMFDDYGIDYFAAFKGCAAETEASFKTIKFLSDKLGEVDAAYIMKIERSDDKIARAVIDNSSKKDVQIETLYSIQAVSADEIKNGETYISYMKKNLEVLKKVLN